MRFETYGAAAEYLYNKGLRFNYSGLGGDTTREYWWFEGEKNALLDHSATITIYRECSLVSDFTDLPLTYEWSEK